MTCPHKRYHAYRGRRNRRPYYNLLKSYDTKEAAAEAVKINSEHTTVLTLQIGLGNVEILERAFGSEKVIAGTTDAAATIVEPGRVKHTA